MSSSSRLLVGLGLGLSPVWLAACEPQPDPVDGPADTGSTAVAELDGAPVPADAHVALAQQGRVRLLAELAPRDLPRMRRMADPSRADVQADRARVIGDATDALAAQLPPGADLARAYHQVPLALVEVDQADALRSLSRLRGVVAWHLDVPHERTLDDSLDLIAQPEAEAAGFSGAGTAVAVIDTGLDYTHSDFGSCTAVGTPAACRVVASEDFAPDDGALDDNGHGTNVAAIVGGVAPGTDLIGLDVFRSDGYAYTSDIAAAIDWVVDNQAAYGIVALNMSLGGGQYTSECRTSAYEVAIAIAEDAGVASAVATGNNGWTDSISAPACAPSAVKVGAVYSRSYGRIGWSSCTDTTTAADQVTCFSNAASFMDLLAPGAIIDAGGYRMGGTSQATPHVAGALAVVASAYPTESPAEWVDRLIDTGVSVTDDRNGLTVPRIDVEAAVQDAIEGDPPGVSLTLDGGAPYTNWRGVDADLGVTDGTEPATEMCLANADDGIPAACTDWLPLEVQARWWMSAGQGEKTVAVWVRDDSGRTSSPATASITLDTIPPVDGAAELSRSGSDLVLSWDPATDTGSGVDRYTVVYSEGSRAPADCASGVEVYTGTATETTLRGLAPEVSHSVRVCAIDHATNPSIGAEASMAARIDGSVAVASGADVVRSTELVLALEAPGAVEVCLSHTDRCPASAWQPLEAETPWTLADADGPQTVSAWFRGPDGTESEVATVDVFLDRIAPEVGEVDVAWTGFGRTVEVSWDGFSDVGSGVTAYRVTPLRREGAGRGCRVGGRLVDAETASVRVRGGRADTVTVAVCAIDAAGNTSAVVVGSVDVE